MKRRRRTQIVWSALLGSMTGVGGLLFALDRTGGGRIDGLVLPALVAPAGPASVEAVFSTRAPLEKSRWRSVVIHHSGSVAGTPANLEARAKADGLKGLGYHFVIGNGRGIEDGELHVGYRWLDQLAGAHAAGKDADWYNLNSIGICLIGNGNREEFTPAQLRRLSQLLAALSRELGIPSGNIVLHGDIAPTSDPGMLFPRASFREQFPATR